MAFTWRSEAKSAAMVSISLIAGCFGDFSPGLLQALLIAPVHNDAGAHARQIQGGLPADAIGRAGHQYCPAVH